MLVTLLENVKALGAEGQNVEVPEGYALNFLYPQHLAVAARRDSANEIAAPRRLTQAEMAEEKLAAEIDGLEVVVKVKAVKGVPKTPVTATEIRAALKELGYSLEKKLIKVSPIAAFGTVEVPVEFPSGFEAVIRVTVEAE